MVALFTRAWIEILAVKWKNIYAPTVALFTRAWIEILRSRRENKRSTRRVALFTRAWIEMALKYQISKLGNVALFTRAWIEIMIPVSFRALKFRRPLHEGVD